MALLKGSIKSALKLILILPLVLLVLWVNYFVDQTGPVSYTHLDVYKRQGADRVGA